MAKILVIDHEPRVRHLLDALLNLNGYDVLLAESGKKGMEVYCLERPDAVVLDLNTPEMDGIAVVQQVRRLNRDQPVIICTGGGNVEMEKRARALGANEIIEKEIPPRRLIGVLNRLLDGPFPRAAAQYLIIN